MPQFDIDFEDNIDITDVENPDEPTQELEEVVEQPEKLLTYAGYFGYDKDFLEDVSSEEELFAKIRYIEEERKLDAYFEDEEIKEAIRLKQAGKISSMKELAKYVHVDASDITEFTNEDDAKAYLTNFYKGKGLDDDEIETNLNNLEVNDKLLSKANDRLTKDNQEKLNNLEKRKGEFLKQQEEEKLAFKREFDNKITRMRNEVVDKGWNTELKTYVNQEVVNVVYDIHTGNSSSDVLKRLGTALINDKSSPELIAFLHQTIKEDGSFSLEPLMKQLQSKTASTVQKSWKDIVNNRKINSGGGGNMPNSDIDWNI